MSQVVPSNAREELAKRDLEQTDIASGAKRLLLIVFAGVIFGVPMIQWASEVRSKEDVVRAAGIARFFPQAKAAWEANRGSGWERMTSANAVVLKSIGDYEDSLERGSFLRKAVLPRFQSLLVKQGAGNEQAYVGRDGWLFYRPSIDLLTGSGFLDPKVLKRRALAGNEWQTPPQPDPRRAIVAFHEVLKARGIDLVLVPTPVKTMIHPEKFAGMPSGRTSPLVNASHEAFVREVRESGVRVFDPSQRLVERAHGNLGIRSTYLATDTHWLPDAMEDVAKALAGFLREEFALSEDLQKYQRHEESVQGMGDIAAMLKLDRPKEKVTIQKVCDAAGKPWETQAESEILLLGDSFSNIFSLEGMGWGKGAGFAEQLSFHLELPIDAIVRNDSAAYATRQILAGELARGKDRLKHKRVVVWQFAARELAIGDWKVIDLPAVPEIAQKKPAPSWGDQPWIATARGSVAQASAIPEEGVPYKDHIRSLYLTDLTITDGAFAEPDAVVFVWDMRERELTPEALLQPGDEVTVRLRPWDEVSATLGRVNRSELDDLELLLATPWWGEVVRN